MGGNYLSHAARSGPNPDCAGRQGFHMNRLYVFAAVFSVFFLTTMVNAQVPLPNVSYMPTDPGTGPEDRDVPFLAWPGNLTADGYVELEYKLSGLANIYKNVSEESTSPEPVVDVAGQPYTTRMLVRRPVRHKDFNGVIYLEILNATARYDGAPMWDQTYESIIADGAAWVGVTYSETSAAFMRDTWGTDAFPAPAGAQPRNRSRYAQLNISQRDFTWDILSQAAALLKAQGLKVTPMRKGLKAKPMRSWAVDAIIMTGYSQSAGFSTTYSNSFYPRYSEADPYAPCDPAAMPDETDCTPIVDGFIIAAGGPNSRRFNGRKSYPRGDIRNFESGRAKTIRFTTESDIKSVRVRTIPEQPLTRTYEGAGTSHVGLRLQNIGAISAAYQFGTEPGPNNCDLPYNPLPTSIPLSAVQHGLARWITHNEEPPASRYIQFSGTFENENAPAEDLTPPAWVRAADGNVIGGVRSPRIEVPLGTYYGSNFYSGDIPNPDFPPVVAIFCRGIIGGFDAFDSDELAALYSSKRQFFVLTWWNTWLAYQEGFLLPVDAKNVMDEARSSFPTKRN
jgi:hypothetical protein